VQDPLEPGDAVSRFDEARLSLGGRPGVSRRNDVSRGSGFGCGLAEGRGQGRFRKSFTGVSQG